jgi:hypothetical protein
VIRWSLKKWALFAEVVGGIGIIVSILYLALEINQNTESVRATNHLALIEQLGVVRSWSVQDAEFADITVRGNENFQSLNTTEKSRFADFHSQYFDVWELGFSMGQRGLVPIDIIDAFNDGYCRSMPSSGARSVWQSGIATYSADFSEYVEACFAGGGWPMGRTQ